MKAAPTLCCLSLAGAIAASPASAQVPTNRGRAQNQAALAASRSQTVSLRNPYTGGTVSVDILLPPQATPRAAVVLLAGSSAHEQQGAASLRDFLAQTGYAVLTLSPIPPSGATEDDTLNTIAALHYLQTRTDLHGVPVGLVGYGEGVRLAAVSAAHGNPAAFLVLLGGAVVPDRLNTLPDNLAPGALPKDEGAQSLQHVRCPVLILIGEYDRQGTHRAAAENSDTLRKSLDTGRHQNYTIKVLTDSDSLLAETGPGGGKGQPNTAAPPAAVWRTVTDWVGKEVRSMDTASAYDTTDTGQHKPIHVYPKTIYGPFNYRSSYIWQPAVGDQQRPFGYWYW